MEAALSRNPSRPRSPSPEAIARIAKDLAEAPDVPREERRWRDLFQLAVWISEQAYRGKPTILKPTTAHVVAHQLSLCHEKPTRDEVALMICNRGEANIVVRAYGCRPEELRSR